MSDFGYKNIIGEYPFVNISRVVGIFFPEISTNRTFR